MCYSQSFVRYNFGWDMPLYQCIDCKKPLSETATGCIGCSSTDPFGRRRAAQRQQMYLTLFALVVGGLLFLAFHFDVLTFAMVKGWIASSQNR